MKKFLGFILLTFFSTSIWAVENRSFGEGAKMDKLIAISKVLASPQKYLGKEITVVGTIVSVCSKRGCWMKLASDKKFQTLRIKVRDGDMVFPFNAKGQTAYATGQLKPIELTKEKAIAYLAHLAEEAKEEFDPTSVTGAMTIYQLSPTGVTIKYSGS
ncbi:MAG: DUF4920 domain-containing protein [Kangiellaceae bacterium]|nr:DUF4920 domain-containing protein [Kangiellaceae bacterium]MCW8999136.1 DUF4920 domain-containing protein [Kangiellaceae bacterium]